jgi:hypothetical protein
MLSCINDSYNRKVHIILNYATWRKRCFVCSKWEHDLLTECSMGRDDAKGLEVLTQNTIMYIQCRPFAVEVEGSDKYKHSAHQAANYSSRTHTHTHTHTHTPHTLFQEVEGIIEARSSKHGVPSTIHKAFSCVLVVRICLQ